MSLSVAESVAIAVVFSSTSKGPETTNDGGAPEASAAPKIAGASMRTTKPKLAAMRRDHFDRMYLDMPISLPGPP